MAEVEKMETSETETATAAETPTEASSTDDASKLEESIEAELKEMAKEVEKPQKPKLQVLENKIIKPASPANVELAVKQLQSLPAVGKGRPKKVEVKNEPVVESSGDNSNGSTPHFQPRNKLRKTFVSTYDVDKELEATMEELEPGSSIQVTNNGNQKSLQEQDLIAILEGNDNAEIFDTKKGGEEIVLNMLEESPPDEAEIALQQMMSLPKVKRGRKAKHETSTSELVSSIVDDWSDNEVEYEVTATESKTSNETTITISPAARKSAATSGGTKSGAGKRKQQQAVVDDAGSVEIIQTVEPPRILNAAKVTSPIKFERRRVIKKKVIWDPDDPTPPPAVSTRIGNTTIKKVTKPEPEPEMEEKKPVVVVNKRKRAGKSEIDKLLGDEGAVNMLYSVERENNSELPEIKTAMEEQLIDVEEEQNNLLKKASALKKAVIKQTKSPPSTTPARAARAKRAPTPTPPSSSVVSPPTATTATTALQKKQTPAKKRKSNQSDSWDYVYKARQNDDSMIVRRRSNSSYSSTTSPRRLSLDQSQPEDSTDVVTTPAVEEAAAKEAPVKETPPPTKKQRGKNFEFAKPNAKKSANKKPMDTSKLVEQIRGKLKPKAFNLTPVKAQVHAPSVVSPDKKKMLDSKQLSIKKYDKFAILILPSIDGKVKDCLTLQLLNKIIAALKQLENDCLCNAVVITSAGTDFCRGINYNILVQIDEEKRSNAAREFASAVRKFIFALATFPKPLIASLQSGEACGIGVTILPLFDIVLARDDVKLSAPYGLMGYFPEGLSVLQLLNKIKSRTVSDLFYCNRSLTAEEGIEHDLITRTFSKSNFNDEVVATARAVIASSTQALLSIKANLTRDLIEQIDEALADEEQMLIQHWTSAECQEKFRNFLTNGHW